MVLYQNYKDKEYRKDFLKKERLLVLLNSFRSDTRLNFNWRALANVNVRYKKLNRFMSVKPRNRCVLSGRTRFVFFRYRMSRFMFRQYVGNGYVSGYKKL